ncbi:MAG: hypothetical protein QTN59_03765 [Candidatus Electrothrix communis]|nr:MAG: hypothetical protein QTN59_03765 [Candidatus Electrothrix communis]
MNADSLKTLQQLHIDFDSLPDNGVQDKIMLLINIVEQLAQENQELKETVKLLKDENNRLKGEQGCPIIRPKTQSGDISSESDRKKKKQQSNPNGKNAILLSMRKKAAQWIRKNYPLMLYQKDTIPLLFRILL